MRILICMYKRTAIWVNDFVSVCFRVDTMSWSNCIASNWKRMLRVFAGRWLVDYSLDSHVIRSFSRTFLDLFVLE